MLENMVEVPSNNKINDMKLIFHSIKKTEHNTSIASIGCFMMNSRLKVILLGCFSEVYLIRFFI